MIKLSSDLSLLRSKKTEVKKEPLESSFFSSRSFAEELSFLALILKLFFVPLCYLIPHRLEPRGVPIEIRLVVLLRRMNLFSALVSLVYFVNIFVFYLRPGERYSNLKKVPKPFSLNVFLQDAYKYSYVISLVLLYYLPACNAPRILFFLKSLVVIMDTLNLYNYYASELYKCDEYFKLENYNGNAKMKLYECYEENHGTKKLTILESTNTCITMKNVGDKDLDVEFYIDRQTFAHTEYCDCCDCEDPYAAERNLITYYKEFEKDCEFTHFCYAKGSHIPPGKVFKIVTTEYNAEDLKEDELCFVVPEHRVFGINTDNYVITTVDIDKDQKHPFDVQLTQKYETKKQRKMKEKHEKSLPAVVYRDVPKKSKKVKKTIKNDKEE